MSSHASPGYVELDVTPSNWPSLSCDQPWGAVVDRFQAISRSLRAAAMSDGGIMTTPGTAEWLVSECSGIRCDVQRPFVSVYVHPAATLERARVLERARINLAAALGSGGSVAISDVETQMRRLAEVA